VLKGKSTKKSGCTMSKFVALISGLFFSSFIAPATTITSVSAYERAVEEKTERVSAFELNLANMYTKAHLEEAGLDYEVFQKALVGYYNLKRTQPTQVKKSVLSIIDFSKASTENRLWIIDLKSKKLLYNTLVAHGKNSGDNFARRFSNVPQSEMSSLGFYATGPTYNGKHGLSLKINGLDAGYNTNAAQRAIVVHGADYVSKGFVKMHGRLGRSQGCPALPVAETSAIINTIKNNSCLFIYADKQQYQSPYLSKEPAVATFASEMQKLDERI
jgi:hypothetical protein